MTIQNGIPEIVFYRLPNYWEIFSKLDSQGIKLVTSKQLGEMLDVSSAQIRKDFSEFFTAGKQGSGYNVKAVLNLLCGILGIASDEDKRRIRINLYARQLVRATMRPNMQEVTEALIRTIATL